MNDHDRLTRLLTHQQHMVLAVTLANGAPWVVPVKIKRREKAVFEWESKLDTVHSRAITERPQVSVTIFEKSGDWEVGLYCSGTAQLIDDDGKGTGRYRFTAEQIWINDETFTKRPVSELP